MSDNIIKLQKMKPQINRLDSIDLPTPIKSAEEKLSEANSIINRSSSVAFRWKNIEGWPVEFVTQNVEKLFGYTAEQFLSGTISYGKCIHPDDLQRVTDEVEKHSRIAGTSEFVHKPYRIITKDNSVRIISDWTFVERDDKGQITHYKGIVEDITDRIRAEEALNKSKEQYCKIVSSIPGIIYQFLRDKQGQYSFPYISEAIEGLIGIKPEVLTQDAGKMFDYIHPDDREQFLQTIEQSAKSLTLWEHEFRIITPEEKTLWIKGSSNPSLSAEKEILWNGVLMDVTERKQIEKELGEKSRLTQIILDSLPFPAMLISNDKVVISTNKVARNVGAKVGGLCWRDFSQSDYIPEKDKKYIKLHNCMPEEGTECTFCLADDTFATGELQNNPEVHTFGKIWDTYWIPVDNKIFLHFAIDITKRKQMEQKLRKRTYDLGERVKELGCLYSISKLIQNPEYSYDDILNGVIEIIPSSMQYPEITCARLKIEDLEIKTDNYIETAWQMSSKIIVSNNEVGHLEIGYLEERRKSDEGPFMKEERALIDAITERLGRYIERKSAEDALKLINEKLTIEQKALKEKNITLKEVLNQIEKEKQQIAVQTQSNVDRVVIPILNKLEEKLQSENKTYLTLLRNSLSDITHPFINKMETRYSKLTPREIEVCNMIKNGLSSKEIAATLCPSVGTVFNQRKTIRKKLGIANDAINLSSFLHSS